MIEAVSIFFIAFLFSFIGSIPPGSINLSVLQLSLDGNRPAAYRFALAAALIEYPYAYIALRFEGLLSEYSWIESNFHIIAASVMISLGVIGLWQSRKPVGQQSKFHKSGFRKGVVISLLNPLAIPFWIGVTAYLRNEGWVTFTGEASFHYYVLGVSAGTFMLLFVVAILAFRLGERMSNNALLRKVPAFIFLGLGIYSLTRYFVG